MARTSLSPPPIRTPFFEKGTTIPSRPWLRWLERQWVAVTQEIPADIAAAATTPTPTVGYGTNASFKSSPPASPATGQQFICSDSPYSYIYDGSAWQAFLHSWPVDEPGNNGFALTKINATPTTTLNEANGGYLFSATGSGDQVVSYVMPVTPSNTLKVAVMASMAGQGGLVLYNANNNKVVFIRTITNNVNGTQLFYSRYTADGGTFSANTATTSQVQYAAAWNNICFILRFDSTNWYVDLAKTPSNILGTTNDNIHSEAKATFIGADYTHVGFGVNLNAADKTWGQHLKILST